jgi:hypothetical protein
LKYTQHNTAQHNTAQHNARVLKAESQAEDNVKLIKFEVYRDRHAEKDIGMGIEML